MNLRQEGPENGALCKARKVRFSGTQTSMLLKPSSGERSASCNFVLLVTLQGTHVSLTCLPHLVPRRAPNELRIYCSAYYSA